MAYIKEFLGFLEASPSPFHAVHQSKQLLQKAGFKEIKEYQSWDNLLERKGRYYFSRNQSALVAFSIGGNYVHGNGFSILGAHTDSPCLKLKPISKRERACVLQVGVQVYGGGLWHTWFDRDLSVAGRVMVKQGDSFHHQLVRIRDPILRIPNLAIHLDRNVKEGFKFNDEVQLTPILSSVEEQLNEIPTEMGQKHHPLLLDRLAKELNCQVDQIYDFELCLYDTQQPAIGGACSEYIHSARLDNLGMSFCSLMALIQGQKLEQDSNIRIVSLFDNEEVGSVSTAGADSNLLLSTLNRLCMVSIKNMPESKTAFEEAMLKSLFVSADMAHALHPNYMDKHEDQHRPLINKGVVIKHNANQRYATTSVTTLILKQLAQLNQVPLQEFVVRNDSPCGSTIGPMLSAKLGMKTIDVGNPQWSMHSIRETCGTKDIEHAVKLFKVFYEEFAAMQAKVYVD